MRESPQPPVVYLALLKIVRAGLHWTMDLVLDNTSARIEYRPGGGEPLISTLTFTCLYGGTRSMPLLGRLALS